MLSDVTRFLCCPACGGAFRQCGSPLLCTAGHGFDIARQGYVNLVTGRAGRRDVDTAPMVAARARFLSGGHYEPLADALAGCARAAIPAVPGDTCILDVGAGTGYFLARVLDDRADLPGIALDASKHAARRAARAHPRAGAVVADAWLQLPVRSGAAGIALVVLAPRNPAELHRVLNGRGRLIVVTPGTRHLREVIEPLGLLRIAEGKQRRLSAQLGQLFTETGQELISWRLHLTEEDLRSLVMMGPSAWHVSADQLDQRIARIGHPASVTAAFTISVYRPVPG